MSTRTAVIGNEAAVGYQRALNGVALLLALIAILVFAQFIARRAIDVPFHDDILDVLGFLINFEDATSLAERIGLLLGRYNDHRTGAARILYLGMHHTLGEIDFRRLALIANISLPLLALLIARAARPGWRVLAFGLTTLLLCNPRGRDFLLWPMSELAFHGVILYALAALLALGIRGWTGVAFAALFSALATQSLASGQIAWLAVLVLLALQWRRSGSGGIRLLGWAGLSMLGIGLFHWGFENPNPPAQVVDFLLGRPLHQLRYFLVLLGSALGFGSVYVASAAGGALLVLLLLLAPSALREERDVLPVFGAFLVISVIAVALGRAPYSGLDYALDPRYGVFSMALLATVVLLLVERFDLHRGLGAWTLLLLASAYCVSIHAFSVALADAALQHRVATYNAGRFPLYGRAQARAAGIVEESVRRGIYTPPARPLLLPLGDHH